MLLTMGRHRQPLVGTAIVAVIAYGVLLGGSAIGEVQAGLLLVNGLVAAPLVIAYVRRAPRRADRLDGAVILGLILFSCAGLLSSFPRQSFDSLLTALVFAAALFMARDVLASAPARRAAVGTLQALSGLLTIAVAVRWLPLVAEWWALTDWLVIPPLDINLDAYPWGHRHDLALLVAILYPSWWLSRPGPVKVGAAVVVGLLATMIVVVDGSRMLWLAIAVASFLVFIPRWVHAAQSDRRVRLLSLVAAALAATLVVGTGLGGTVSDRILTFTTLGARSAMWLPLTELWLTHPLAGLGPGSFPWLLQLTDFFDVNTWAPRHPDSLLFQLLPEAGLLGLASVGLVGLAVVSAVRQSSLVLAKWALLTAAITGIGANPTDFRFLVVVAAVWVALAAPHSTAVPREPAALTSRIRAPFFAALTLIGIAYGSTVVAAFQYEDARSQIHRGDLPSAEASLTSALRLDPGMAIYFRQRGTLRLLLKNEQGAIRDLSHAAALNASDDLSWRILAIARMQAGDHDGSLAALRQAIARQRSDPTNLLLLADGQRQSGDDFSAERTIAEIVQAWPTITLAPRWPEFLPESMSPKGAIDAAISRWQAGLAAPSGQALELIALGQRWDLASNAGSSSALMPDLAEATIAVYRCDPEAELVLDGLPTAAKRTAQYWALVIIDAANRGGVADADGLRLYRIMTGRQVPSVDATSTLNPLWENDPTGFSADTWGYRRSPIMWPEPSTTLPSPAAGAARWFSRDWDRESSVDACLSGHSDRK